MSELDPIVFEFDRYIKGVKMAQGVTIERERDLPSAMRRAATLASRGLNGEVPVLVLRSTVSPLSDGDGRIKALEAELLAAREALRPFATLELNPDYPDEAMVGTFGSITAGDFRRARALTGNRSGSDD